MVYTYYASISTSTRNLHVNRCDASISALCLCLCLCRPGLHPMTQAQAQENGTISILLCLRHCVVPVNRDDTRKETMSAMLESNLVPKGSLAKSRQIFMLLRLRMSPYAYHTYKHPCAYVCACVVRVNQALQNFTVAILFVNYPNGFIFTWLIICKVSCKMAGKSFGISDDQSTTKTEKSLLL